MELFTSVDMAVLDFFTYAFTIEISNDAFYGGCGSFSCSTTHLNGGTVQLLHDTGTIKL